jgi:hypothetical protein
MPDWLTSALVAGAAIALMVWLMSLVGVSPKQLLRALLGDLGTPSTAVTPKRTAARKPTIAIWVLLILAVVALVLLLRYVITL